MFNYCFVATLILAMFVLGFILASKIGPKKNSDTIILKKPDNTDMPCTEAFENMEISNAWGVAEK